ncbi:hypothetical protein [Actinomadura sp. 3N508]|uniref:Cap15 family cyclic dinucleotide receptor domain-containing protein n=1 Tax=Actinomadura sp. 3N508 TaxID=3375153 RepID=UPI0037A47BA0
MGGSKRITIAVYIATGVWSVALFIAGVRLPGAGSKILGFLPLAIVALFAIYDHWLWKLKLIAPLVRRPNLNGTWRGTLTSMRPDASGSEAPHAPIDIFVVIKQTFLDITVTLLSAESRSRSISSLLQSNRSGDFTVYYHYSNVPGLAVRDRSSIHSGGAKLEVDDLFPHELAGEYWTDRRSRGTFQVAWASKKHYGSFDKASTELA